MNNKFMKGDNIMSITSPKIEPLINDFIKELEMVLGQNLSKVILYGSYARGDQRENSDIDLMILTSLDNDDEIRSIEKVLYDVSFEYEMEHLINISVIVDNEKHFYDWVNDLPFYRNVEQEGVVLVA
jgi:predicted nucleotidyltransferase